MIELFLRIFGIKRKPKRDFPKWCSAECHGALNEAIAIIKKVGVHKVLDADIQVKFVKGEKRFGNDWAWWVKTVDYVGYVLGLCSGKLIEIGIDPNRMTDPSAVNKPTLVHEFVHRLIGAHHWHHPAYDGLVPGWKSAREIVGKFK